VGPRNYTTFMDVVRRCLNDDGLFLLHTIGSSPATKMADPWMSRYIFPNSKLPSAREICAAIEGRFIMEDWQNFGADYDRTLMCWFRNFERSWCSLCDHYDERFFRMWKYYLLSCAGMFRARANQLWQIMLSPLGVQGGYRIARTWAGRTDFSREDVHAGHLP
jgi:cyclopropane-fatty-acyl-phospholipid synthase